MEEPLTLCLMLVNERRAMVSRAIRAFHSQTYKNKRLLLWNNGPKMGVEEGPAVVVEGDHKSIGAMRNDAVGWALDQWPVDIIAHWDSDDWSHPLRLAEQSSALLGAELTGYNDLLIWNETRRKALWYQGAPGYVVGSSFCYRSAAWRCRRFLDRDNGEDTEWQRHFRRDARSSLPDKEARLIAALHPGNSHMHDSPSFTPGGPEMDAYCRTRMAL